jgi:hypothetical protein
VLESLIELKGDLRTIRASLASFPFDHPEEEVTLTTDHVRTVLERFIDSQLSEQDVEDWANIVEGRDDIGYDEKSKETLIELVFVLANPVLNGSLDLGKARDLLRQLDTRD